MSLPIGPQLISNVKIYSYICQEALRSGCGSPLVLVPRGLPHSPQSQGHSISTTVISSAEFPIQTSLSIPLQCPAHSIWVQGTAQESQTQTFLIHACCTLPLRYHPGIPLDKCNSPSHKGWIWSRRRLGCIHPLPLLPCSLCILSTITKTGKDSFL